MTRLISKKGAKNSQERPRLPTAKTNKVGAVKSGQQEELAAKVYPGWPSSCQANFQQISRVMLRNAKSAKAWLYLGAKV